MVKYLKILCILLALVLIFSAAFWLDRAGTSRSGGPALDPNTQTRPAYLQETEPTMPTETETVPEETEPEETLPTEYLLTFGGNCTLGCTDATAYHGNGIIKTVGEDYRYPLKNAAPFFEGDDFTLLNLECPLTDTKAYSNTQQIYSGPSAYIEILTDVSLEGVTLASDHIRDHGEAGYASTTGLLKDAGIFYAEKDVPIQYTTANGLTLGIYSVLYRTELKDLSPITDTISDLTEHADIVIFAPHWGPVGYYLPTDSQQALAHAAIDAGADIVCGTHPSVLQPIEEYGDGVIYYSLGNFCAGNLSSPKDYDTALIRQQILREPDGTFRLGERTILPFSISSSEKGNNYQPTPYAETDAGYSSTLSKLSGTYHLKSIS